ncbi:10306_t:CDS:2 [Ambispora gerdemannii]|uniref:10306_t:CDS:1 n=1 Tax=Ambispora gerdemannii TaxID=144530 RepID=A0A9N8VAG6_9GLOM|nr:10306_t:CDS:2 [Ambispora gerdemannii]
MLLETPFTVRKITTTTPPLKTYAYTAQVKRSTPTWTGTQANTVAMGVVEKLQSLALQTHHVHNVESFHKLQNQFTVAGRGVDKPVFQRSLWCSIKCRNLTPNWQSLVVERSSQLCLVCKRENALQSRDICSDACQDYITRTAPCLLNLPTNGQKFKDISNQFVKTWKHAHKPVPDVTSVWKIYCGEAMNNRYNAYRDAVERKQQLAGKPFPRGDGMRRREMTAGNEQRRFHGTKMNCFIGLLTSASLCYDNTCAICCIIREGYKLKFVGTGEISLAFQRFGRGLYFSGTSSKSDDYNEKSLKSYNGLKYKAMLLNKVVVGKGFPQTVDDTNLVKPPNDYDSILGEPSPTGNLNYDEVVVYNEAACLPQYLIIYRV